MVFTFLQFNNWPLYNSRFVIYDNGIADRLDFFASLKDFHHVHLNKSVWRTIPKKKIELEIILCCVFRYQIYSNEKWSYFAEIMFLP